MECFSPQVAGRSTLKVGGGGYSGMKWGYRYTAVGYCGGAAEAKSGNPIVLSGYPLKLHFQIPCFFPVQRQICPVPIYVICDYHIDTQN